MIVKITWQGASVVVSNVITIRTFESAWYPPNNCWLEMVDSDGISTSVQMDGCAIELEMLDSADA
jgi:hypothetical protein